MVLVGGVLIFALLAIDVVLLTTENRSLKNSLNTLSVVTRGPLVPGDQLPSFLARTFAGDTISIEYSTSEKYRLFLLLSSSCHLCESTLVHWNSIEPNPDFEILGISLSEYEETLVFITTKPVRFTVVSPINPSFVEAYKVTGVPATVLVTPLGVVQRVWGGVLTTDALSTIQSELNRTRET